MLDKHLIMSFLPGTNKNSIVTGAGFRISVLFPCLFRVEVNNDGKFTDEATQSVFYRNFPDVKFKVRDEGGTLLISTDKAQICFDKASKKVSYIIPNGMNAKVKCSNKGNLKGTNRTLDQMFGAVPIANGILSKTGVAVMDDSSSLIFNVDGEIRPRAAKEKDYYIFVHGKDYYGALRNFFALTGKTPLIPRYALGNWWSRYRAYTEKEYIGVMDGFMQKQIPLTVATIDMDWHWTNLNKQFGMNYKYRAFVDNPCAGGWTGYSWNTDLFPDYLRFLKNLHDRNLKVTLNLHPADGIRWFETMYGEMCKELGLDADKKEVIPFDITDSKFINAYFKIVHKPYEKDGVDFWWIDWQQGKKSKIEGLDPLYSLNHYHYLDNAKTPEGGDKAPMILSRYAGLGSHRYPLGFSGDTAMNWAILRFIPYFTATATNAGYTWWSHDIGGHHFGRKDDELYLRWLQFGVFNPILRLHSTSNDLGGKEPWRYCDVAEHYATQFLRLRKKLIPYIYTMNYLNHTEDLPLCTPMYYKNPDNEAAYRAKNEYYFGTELIAAPITEKLNKKLRMARVKVFLPKGRWTDIFTSQIYEGEGEIYMYRGLSSIPVLAKEGAIIPLDADGITNGAELPAAFEIFVYRGTNTFTMAEHDENGGEIFTKMRVEEKDGNVLFSILPPSGSGKYPGSRSYTVFFKDLIAGEAEITAGGKTFISHLQKDAPAGTVTLSADETLSIVIKGAEILKNSGIQDYIVNTMSKMQDRLMRKTRLYRKLKPYRGDEKAFAAAAYKLRGVGKFVREAFRENI